MQKQLEEEVSKTAAVVTEWKTAIAMVETASNTANTALMRSKKQREIHALKASLGDAAAIAAIKSARSEQDAAQQTLDDLTHALPAAAAQLAEAEKSAESARHSLAQFHADALKRKRIDIAAQLDTAIAEFARLYASYEKLGRDIVNMDVIPRTMHGVADHESTLGDRRVRASLPSFLGKLFAAGVHDEQRKELLAASEARFWNLPAVETNTTRAA